LRIVTALEYRYPEFPGLNLSWEVLEAQAHHSKRPDDPEVRRFRTARQPTLEAQVVDAADSLAYDTHDIDDALGVGLIACEDLEEVEFWRRAAERVRGHYPNIGPLQFQPAVVRALIDWQVIDLLAQTRQQLLGEHIHSIEEVRQAAGPLVGPGPEVRAMKTALEEFLRRRVYRHARVARMAAKGSRLLRALFDEFCGTPDQMPARYVQRTRTEPLERVVCDYLAGMTDRYAQQEYVRLFQPLTDV
jgi:dGTPase